MSIIPKKCVYLIYQKCFNPAVAFARAGFFGNLLGHSV